MGRIPNPPHPNKCRHRLSVLLLDGLLIVVFQFASRHEVNREMTRSQFEAHLKLLFPELETLPHADTLLRLLRDIDVSQKFAGDTLRDESFPQRTLGQDEHQHTQDFVDVMEASLASMTA